MYCKGRQGISEVKGKNLLVNDKAWPCNELTMSKEEKRFPKIFIPRTGSNLAIELG
jgi:hypothetical protein